MPAKSAKVVSFPTPAKKRMSKRVSVKKELGVIDSIREAFKFENLLATTAGFILGGFVPLATFFVSHTEVDMSVRGIAMLFLVLGGLVFSAKTVWQWTSEAFGDPWKATGFVILLEGVMTLSTQMYLCVGALVLLTVVNGIATGVKLCKK
jgi:hypothetical protein